MLRSLFMRFAITAAAVVLVSGTSLGIASASEANSQPYAAKSLINLHAPGAQIHTFRFTVHTDSGSAIREETAVCTASAGASANGKTTIYYAGDIFCTVENFAVSDDWGFYSYGKLYAYDADFGTSTVDGYGSLGSQKGGSIGHRNVIWCFTVTDNEGDIGGGCVVAAINI